MVTIYTATAGQLSDTKGVSTGTAVAIPIRFGARVKIAVTALSLATATKINVWPMIGDDAATPVYMYDCDLGGSEFPFPVDGISGSGNALPAIPADGRWFKVDVTADVAGTATTCTVKALVIYPERNGGA